MRRIIIVRHGPAVRIGENGVETDSDRMLSEEGIIKTRLAAGGLNAMKCQPWQIVTSPLLRARQTADILSEALSPEKGIEESDFLCPGTSMEKMISWLQDQPSYPMMLVGHMPDMAELASTLVAGNQMINITVKKAAACSITFDEDIDPGEGCLDWLLQPRHLRALAR